MVKSQGSRATLCWFNENEVRADYRMAAPSRKSRAMGRKTFQARYISWSYRNRGRVPRAQI